MNVMRWWNLKRALRDGPFMNTMTILVGELREWRLHQDFLLNPPLAVVALPIRPILMKILGRRNKEGVGGGE